MVLERWEAMDGPREAGNAFQAEKLAQAKMWKGAICLEDPLQGRIVSKTASFTSIANLILCKVRCWAFTFIFFTKALPKGHFVSDNLGSVCLYNYLKQVITQHQFLHL